MEEILASTTDNATSSWYGFEAQGRIGVLYLLERLKKVDSANWNNLVLEYEYMEDFAIATKENGNLIYEDIYQVKARGKLQSKDIKKVYGELGFKKTILRDANVHLISMCEITSKIDQKKTTEDYINKYIDETEMLKNFNDIKIIKQNLHLTDKQSKLKTIRKIVRKKFKEVDDIKSINEVRLYCEDLISEYMKYKDYVDEVDINIIVEDFDQINESILQNIKYIFENLEPEKVYKQTKDYIQKVMNALIFFVSSSLEKFVLKKDRLVFSITGNELIDVILKDQSQIDELQYLYLNNKKLEKQFVEYCKDCENCKEYYKQHENINEYEIICEAKDDCELNKLIRHIRWISLEKFKSLILNCNPHIDRKNTDFDTWTSVVESSKLQNFIFDEIRKNKYLIKDKDIHIYLKSIDDNYLFSFIDIEKQKKLLRNLEDNFMYNRNIYEDNEAILNRNLKFTYVPGQTLSKNQHWEEKIENQKNKILSKSVEFIRFKDIGGKDEESNK